MRFKRLVLSIIPMLLLSACNTPVSSESGDSHSSTSEVAGGSSSSGASSEAGGSSSNGSGGGTHGDSSSSKHTHTYSSSYEYNNTYHWHPSTCEHNVVSGKEEHTYDVKSVAPTYESKGYMLHACKICDYSYKDSYTDKLKYAISWIDEDGTLLRTDHIEKGETPSYGKSPEKEMEKFETYTFTGWEPAITPASCDATYKATYQAHASDNEFTVKFNSNGGEAFPVSLTKQKDTPLSLPDTWPYKQGYIFRGWSSIYEETIYGAEDRFSGDYNVYLYANWLPVCGRCYGSGGYYRNTCAECGGTGKSTKTLSSNGISLEYSCSCSKCNGTGKMAEVLNCSKCSGFGYTLEDGPKIEKVTPNSITLAETDGYEYSMDGSSWQTSPTFSDLTVNTAYSFYQRKAAKGKAPYGLASKATSGTTLKSSYSITYYLNSGVNDPDNPDSYSYESEDITFKDPSREGYTFDGWYSDSSLKSKVTDIPSGSSDDLELYAKWSANLHQLAVESEKETRGTVSVSGSGYTDEEITVTAKVSTTYVFKGWYSGDQFVSGRNPYTFAMPTHDFSLTAMFLTMAEADDLKKQQQLGLVPAFSTDSNTLTYGLYPQTRVSDETLISSLDALITPESNGWYLHEGAYYAKKSASWFKCEPIEWKISSSSFDGTYSLLSSALLDTHCYYSSKDNRTTEYGKTIYPNNYEYSDIRKWLNGDFYNSAFALGDSLIQTVTVDNSAKSTGDSRNEYACDNTKDNVYLQSCIDYEDRYRCKLTDWAKANGAEYCQGALTYYGYYWTRSPSENNSCYVKYVYCYMEYIHYGWFTYYEDSVVTNPNLGVRPGIQIKIARGM